MSKRHDDGHSPFLRAGRSHSPKIHLQSSNPPSNMCYQVIRYTSCSICSMPLNQSPALAERRECRRESIRVCPVQGSARFVNREGVCDSSACIEAYEAKLEAIRIKLYRYKSKLAEEGERRLPDFPLDEDLNEMWRCGMARERRRRRQRRERSFWGRLFG